MLFFPQTGFLPIVGVMAEAYPERSLDTEDTVGEQFMRWFKPAIRNSISALLGSDIRRDTPDSMECVRQAMLGALGVEGARLNPKLSRQLQYLHDIQALWFARSELVAVLSSLHGEARAVAMVRELTPLFEGRVSPALLESARARR
jgi:hypothetical protein